MRGERVVENLNQALVARLEEDPRVYVLGEDVLDPYGGAFKATRGLSSRFPDRVLATPLSEGGIVGMAGGLALCGDRPIVEIMFADFVTLAFDQILNFASKSVTMYGRKVPLNLVVRCPVGGNRGYGPTHSQSPQKHFIGIPNLSLYELSPLHDAVALLERLTTLEHPCLLFEDKVLYTRRRYTAERIDELFRIERLAGDGGFVRVFSDQTDRDEALLICPGGLFERCLEAARELFLEHEIGVQIVVPERLYPFRPGPIVELAGSIGRVFVVEEGVPGGGWGAEVASVLHRRLWGRLTRPVEPIQSADSIIPTAIHLEHRVLVQAEDIYRRVREGVAHA